MKLTTIVGIKPEPKNGGRRKGVGIPERKDEQGRRRISKGIYVKYFDPAQLKNGTERPFYYGLEFTPLGYTPFPLNRGRLSPYPPFTDQGGHMASYNAYVLDGNRDDWADIYREIKADENVQFFATYTSNYVEGKGYPVSDELNIVNQYQIGFNDGGWEQLWLEFFTVPSQGTFINQTNKITRNPSFSDPAVSFTLDASCDVFLCPSPKFWEGRASSWRAIDPWPGGTWPKYVRRRFHLLNHFLRTIPRSFAVNNPLYFDWWSRCTWPDHPIAPCFGNWPVHRVLPQYLREFFYGLFTGISEARALAVDAEAWAFGPGGFEHDPTDYIVGDAFPNSYSSGLVVDIDDPFSPTSWMDKPMVRWFSWYRPIGLISAIIHKKGGEDPGWYYIWRTIATSVSTGVYRSGSAGFGGADRGAMV